MIRDLQQLGIETVDTLDDVDHGSAVVIRAHGVRPDVMERASARGLEVIDGTCTWVIQEQKEIVKLVEEGYTIVLLGTPKHPEVIGLLGFAPNAIVVDEEEDWDQIPRKKKMALISQSTQPPWKFEKLAAFMVSRSHELKIVNTVCPVTIRRQEDTIETAREVDLMVVVGGRSSAEHQGAHAPLRDRGDARLIQIESVKDLVDPGVFDGAKVVGVTGGTSTPIEDLHAVAQRILEIAGTPTAACEGNRTRRRRVRPRRDAGRPNHLASDHPPRGQLGRSRWPPGPESRSSRSSGGRTSGSRRSSTGSSASERRSSRTGRGRPGTGSTARATGTPGGSWSSTPAGSRSTRATRSRPASRTRRESRSPRRT